MYNFLFDNKSIKLPESWSEVAFSQFVKMQSLNEEKNTILETLSILSGEPYDSWLLCRDVDIDEKVVPFISFIYHKVDFEKLPIPKTINYKGKEYKGVKDIGLETFGQKIIFQDYLNKSLEKETNIIQTFPYIVAIYLQPIITESEFNTDKVEELEKEINEMPVTVVIPLATFFLQKSIVSIRKKMKYLLRDMSGKSWKQELKNLKNLEFSEPLTHSQKGMF
jgi:hypothetical protein